MSDEDDEEAELEEARAGARSDAFALVTAMLGERVAAEHGTHTRATVADIETETAFADGVFGEVLGRGEDHVELVAIALCNIVADFVDEFAVYIDLDDRAVGFDFGQLTMRLWQRYTVDGPKALTLHPDDDDEE